MSLNIFSALLGLLFVGMILWLIRRDRMPIMQSMWWMVVATIILILGIQPRLVDILSRWVGVSYGPALLFSLAILVLLIKLLLEDIEVSKDRRRIFHLVQKMGILEEQVRRLKNEVNQLKPSKPGQDSAQDKHCDNGPDNDHDREA